MKQVRNILAGTLACTVLMLSACSQSTGSSAKGTDSQEQTTAAAVTSETGQTSTGAESTAETSDASDRASEQQSVEEKSLREEMAGYYVLSEMIVFDMPLTEEEKKELGLDGYLVFEEDGSGWTYATMMDDGGRYEEITWSEEGTYSRKGASSERQFEYEDGRITIMEEVGEAVYEKSQEPAPEKPDFSDMAAMNSYVVGNTMQSGKKVQMAVKPSGDEGWDDVPATIFMDYGKMTSARFSSLGGEVPGSYDIRVAVDTEDNTHTFRNVTLDAGYHIMAADGKDGVEVILLILVQKNGEYEPVTMIEPD
ncbi:MAG: hypothetical protein IJR00_08850 [Lachnospiraceae bacterium]|nr:hypothetical protein [Lachnospiraceae bacterium]